MLAKFENLISVKYMKCMCILNTQLWWFIKHSLDVAIVLMTKSRLGYKGTEIVNLVVKGVTLFN